MNFGHVFNAEESGQTEVVVELVYAVNNGLPNGTVSLAGNEPKIGGQIVPMEGFDINWNVSKP